MNYKIEKFSINDFQKIKKIYLDSFSKENRFSLLNLSINVILKRASIHVLHYNNEVVGFIYSINNKSESFILYFAIKENYRNKRIGSYLLNWYLNINKTKEIYLNIDEVNKKHEDYTIRKKRLEFYLRNNFYDTNYLSVNGNSIGNTLSNKKEFSVEKYKLLDKKISRWFLCKTDEIKNHKSDLKENF